MKIVFSIIVVVVVLALVGWWAFSRMTPADKLESEPSPSSTAGYDVPSQPSSSPAQAVPELNPVEKTNPFADSYKNPFAN